MARKKSKSPGIQIEMDPDTRSVTAAQAAFLAAETGIDSAEIAALPLGKLGELLRLRIDPSLLLYRKICGRVVKRDPETGELWPVPNATVYVEDTDCSFLGFFPTESPWSWIFPFRCRREVIAVVQADECGEFCVYVPRWDIDRIVRWRRERICFPEFVPPRIRDVLEDLPVPLPWPPPPPIPGPDPVVRPPRVAGPPRPVFEDPQVRTLLETRLGPQAAARFAAATPTLEFGASTAVMEAMLDEPAPLTVRAPLPAEPQAAAAGVVPDEILAKVDFDRPIGPFRICRDVWVREWVSVLDVPDITFRATQTRDDGTEVTIYEEGFFDVRWNDGDPGPVVLEASPDAVAVPICGAPPVDCEDVPVIDTVGFMSLLPAYHDNSAGTGARVNRPRPAAAPGVSNCSLGQVSPAHAPYAGRLDLFGCHHVGDATHYRLLYRYEGGIEQPFLGVAWWAPRQTPLAPLYIAPDPAGWYAIQPSSALLRHPHWLFAWPSWKDANGAYEVVLQLGKPSRGGMVETTRSAAVAFTVDNATPDLQLTALQWRFASEPVGALRNLPLICPVIDRAGGGDVVVRVAWTASATHLRDARASMAGCGGPDPLPAPGTSSGDFCHWYVGPGDNTVTRVSEFLIPGTSAAGCYTAHASAYSRAFNPSDGNAGPLFDWWINDVQRWTHTSRAISVVD